MKPYYLKIIVFFSLGMACTSLSHAQSYYLHKEEPNVINRDTTTTQIDEVVSGLRHDFDEAVCGVIVKEYWYYNKIRFGIGYSYQSFYKPVSPGIDFTYGFQVSLDGYFRRLYLGLSISPQSGLVETENFYSDKNKGYDWVWHKKADTLPISLRTGFCFIQKNKFRMTTYAGIGNAKITQKTGLDENHASKLNTSVINGTRAELGLSADIVLYGLNYPLNGIELSANFGGARTEYEYFGTTYSLNASITLHLTLRP